jgi:hypothetical protein
MILFEKADHVGRNEIRQSPRNVLLSDYDVGLLDRSDIPFPPQCITPQAGPFDLERSTSISAQLYFRILFFGFRLSFAHAIARVND